MQRDRQSKPVTRNLDYAETRQLFLSTLTEAAENLNRGLPPKTFSLETESVDLKSHPGMTTDVAVVGTTASKKTDRGILVLSSGVHGIEGFAGSVLQRSILQDTDLLKDLLAAADLVLIHAVNPWGMARHERTDPNNIDLNRNAHDSAMRFKQVNGILPRLRHILAPQLPARTPSLGSRLKFYGSVAGTLSHLGLQRATAAVMNGHFEYPMDLFYGGQALCPHLESVANTVARLLLTKESGANPGPNPHRGANRPCCVIDLHTGLGPTGGLTLLMAQAPGPRHTDRDPTKPNTLTHLDRLFRCQYEERQGPVVPGIFCEWLAARLEGHRPNAGALQPWQAMVFEIGTLGKSLVADLKALHRLVLNNQLRHFGMAHGHEDAAAKIRWDFVDLFAPENPDWWQDLRSARRDDLALLMRTLALGPLLVAGSTRR